VAKARVLRTRVEALEQEERDSNAQAIADVTQTPEAKPAIHSPATGTVPPPLPADLKAKRPAPKSHAAELAIPIETNDRPTSQSDQPDVGDRIRSFINARVDTSQQGWEVALATYLLPRLGILVLTIAVVLGLTMAADRGGPEARVALGYLAAAILLGLAWWLESRYQFYARVLFSGGFALSYFVTFATHYIEYARVIETPAITLAMLAAVVGAWALLAQWRQSRTMAVLVTALGHLTFALSVYSEDDLGNFPVAGLLILAAGSAFFLLRNGWYYVAFLGIIGSYANHFYWMANSEGNDLPFEFWASMAVLGSYFFIFALSELFSPEALRRERIPTWFRSLFVTLNTACFFAIASLLVNGFSFTENEHDTFRYLFAIVLLCIGLGYLHVRKEDPLYNAYITKGVVIFTLGLAYTFGDNALATSLAVEAVALLVSARRSGLIVTRILAFGAAAIAFGVAADTLTTQSPIAYGAEGYSALLAQAAITVLALLTLSVLHDLTDWTRRLPTLSWLAEPTRFTLSRLDLCEVPRSAADTPKFLNGLFAPYVYALGGALLFIPYVSVLSDDRHAFVVLATGAIALTGAATLLNAKPLGIAAIMVTLAASALASLQWLGIADEIPLTMVAIAGLALLLGTALTSERRFIPNRDGLSFHQSAWGPYVLYGAFALPLALFLEEVFPKLDSSIAIAITAAAFAGAYLVLHPGAISILTSILFAWAAYNWLRFDDPEWWPYLAAALIAASLAGDRFFAFTKRDPIALVTGPVVLVVGWIIALRLGQQESQEPWLSHAVIGIAFGYMFYAAGFQSIPGAALSILTAVLASGSTVIYAFNEDWAITPMSIAFGACAMYWIALEREDAFAGRRLTKHADIPIHGIFIGIAVVLGVIALERVPQFRDFYLTVSWTVLALVIFGISAITREKFYRYAGLAVFALVLGRAFLHDALNLDGLQRVAAFGVLGIVLLIVAFGYIHAVKRFRSDEEEPTPE
jgi:uncharacterized membrane protein